MSPKSFDEATALGATATIDRNGDVATDTIAAVGKVDTLIDLVGPAAWPTAIGALKGGGRFVSTIPGGFPSLPANATGHTVAIQPHPDRLAELTQLVADDRLTAVYAEASRFLIRHAVLRLQHDRGGQQTRRHTRPSDFRVVQDCL